MGAKNQTKWETFRGTHFIEETKTIKRAYVWFWEAENIFWWKVGPTSHSLWGTADSLEQAKEQVERCLTLDTSPLERQYASVNKQLKTTTDPKTKQLIKTILWGE